MNKPQNGEERQLKMRLEDIRRSLAQPQQTLKDLNASLLQASVCTARHFYKSLLYLVKGRARPRPPACPFATLPLTSIMYPRFPGVLFFFFAIFEVGF